MPVMADIKRCVICGSSKTYNNNNGLPHWYKGPTCAKCARVKERKGKPRIDLLKRINFKGRRIYLEENPRIGVCNLCRNVVPFDCERTAMHHEKYDESEPLKYTLEVCTICHPSI